MTTVSSVIASGRYDLRDTDSNRYEYSDAELLDYMNRALFQLDSALSSLHSDWVYTEYTGTTLASGDNSVARPNNCICVREIWIGDDELEKKSPQYIYYKRKIVTDTGEPDYFAEVGVNILFERTADTGYALTIYYDKYSNELAVGDGMPYGDQFNQPLREAMILVAKKRNEYDVNLDAQLFDFFMISALQRSMSKQFSKKPYYLGF